MGKTSVTVHIFVKIKLIKLKTKPTVNSVSFIPVLGELLGGWLLHAMTFSCIRFLTHTSQLHIKGLETM